MPFTAQEVLLVALINRARLDPVGEAARFGISLNEGLAAGTLGTQSRQPLAFSTPLQTAADGHSQAMIDSDFFDHANPNSGSTPQSRANAAGYVGNVGENIAFRGSSGAIDPTAMIVAHHADLFIDSGIAGRGHRLNILNGNYQQVGIGQVIGLFTQNGSTFNASMVTEDFGFPNGGGQFLTGIAYNDTDGNAFYSVGEGRSGVSVAFAGGPVSTGSAGEYSAAIGTGTQAITFSGGGLPQSVVVNAEISAGFNALVDLVGTSTIETSTSLTAVSGVITIIGLGNIGLTLTGAGGAETLIGTSGSDTLNSLGGNDVVAANDGNDVILGGDGNDSLFGGTGVDTMVGEAGSDLIYGNEQTDYIDGRQGNDQLFGGDGIDVLFGDGLHETYGLGGDTIHGDAGDDIIMGESGAHVVAGALDILYGDAGNDTIFGGGGNDWIFGGDGSDVIDGGEGSDFIVGGTGADILVGSADSTAVGGPSATSGGDLFSYSNINDGGDTIYGFDTNFATGNDGVDLRSLFDTLGYTGINPRADSFLFIFQNGANTDVYVDANGATGGVQLSHMFTLDNVAAISLTDSYFLF